MKWFVCSTSTIKTFIFLISKPEFKSIKIWCSPQLFTSDTLHHIRRRRRSRKNSTQISYRFHIDLKAYESEYDLRTCKSLTGHRATKETQKTLALSLSQYYDAVFLLHSHGTSFRWLIYIYFKAINVVYEHIKINISDAELMFFFFFCCLSRQCSCKCNNIPLYWKADFRRREDDSFLQLQWKQY